MMNTPFSVARILWILILVFGISMAQTSEKGITGTYNVLDFGAVADGKTLDSPAIQAAIDACANTGGTVLLPPGSYLSGSLELKSGVNLHVSRGATLLGSTKIADYREYRPEIRSYNDIFLKHSLIYGEKLQDIAITGEGVIDGQGGAFVVTTKKKPDRYFNRPFIIRLVQCRNVRIENLTLQNSAMWMQQYLVCENLSIRGIRVYNHCNKNNDMIDIDGCRNVVMSDCFGDSDDDAITLKSTSGFITENVTITNCVVSSHVNAIKLGTESHGGFRNIVISNIVVKPSASPTKIYGLKRGAGGITLATVDGGILDGVQITNVRIDSAETPIFLRLGDRARTYYEGQLRPSPGVFRNVTISNVIATAAGDLGCSVTGIPGHAIENVSLRNIRIDFSGGGTAEDLSLEVPELPDMYPDASRFGKRPAYGLYARHVKGLTLENVTFGFADPDVRPALLCDDVERLRVEGLSAAGMPETTALIRLRNTRDALIASSRAAAPVDAFLLLEGAAATGVKLLGNDFHNARIIFKTSQDVGKNALQLLGNFQ